MNRGRGRNTGGSSAPGGRGSGTRNHFHRRQNHVGECRPSTNESFVGKDGLPLARGKDSEQMSIGSGSGISKNKPSTTYLYMPKKTLPDGNDGLLHTAVHPWEEFHKVQGNGLERSKIFVDSEPPGSDLIARTVELGGTQSKTVESDTSFHIAFPLKVNISCHQAVDESHVPSKLNAKDQPSQEKDLNTEGLGDSGLSEHTVKMESFDICLTKTGTPFMLKPSLLVKNREKRNEIKRSIDGHNGRVLRSGMVLLKNYLSLSDQVNIVQACRELGLGTGGFYQPGYRDGGKLHLKMMCLGKNWDPGTGQYGDRRQIDDATPPKIPCEFIQFVEKAIRDSHALIARNSRPTSVEDIIPWMSPNICLVNFYTASGRLGLHQDKDESQESLGKGLPVVSFSIGDSAEFLYGDHRDADKADKVVLESGDVLLFGGKARHLFHGVTSILSRSAPKVLLKETNLRPGRLNLTFREY